MRTYYLSGPMRGVAHHNYPAFLSVETALGKQALRDGGYEILNPARNFGGDTTRATEEYMQVDLENVLRSDCVILLPGWHDSEGAKIEVACARATGKEFWLAIDDGFDWAFVPVEVPTADNSPRGAVLDEAKALITGDRNSQYGPPTQDFIRTANMASAFGFEVNGKSLQSYHVAVFMMILKVSRLAWNPAKRDSWVDAAGYSACGLECSLEEAKNVSVQ